MRNIVRFSAQPLILKFVDYKLPKSESQTVRIEHLQKTGFFLIYFFIPISKSLFRCIVSLLSVFIITIGKNYDFEPF